MKRIIICIVASLTMVACSSDDPNIPLDGSEDLSMIPFKAGDVDTTQVFKDGVLIATQYSEFINYGTDKNPCLIPVNKEYIVADEQYRGIINPLYKDELEAFVEYTWSDLFDLEVSDKATLYQHFHNYVSSRNINMSGLVRMNKNNTAQLISLSEEVDINFNEAISLMDNKVFSNDQLRKILISKPQPETKGVIGDIISILSNGKKMIDAVCDLVKNNSVFDVQSNTIAVLNSDDINTDHYSTGKLDVSGEYHVKYQFIWTISEAKFRIETNYDSSSPSVSGKYIKSVYVRPTKAHVSTGTLIMKATYSNAVNSGTDEMPVASAIGSVAVQYGDCCWVQKFLNINFRVYGDKGLTIF